MARADMEVHEEDFQRLQEVLGRLREHTHARAVLLIDKSGQPIATTGSFDDLDTTSLASLTAGNVAATDGLAKLIGEREFSVLFHQGEKDHIHISLAGERAIILVLFDDRSSLGIVRLRAKQAGAELAEIFADMAARSSRGDDALGEDPFGTISDADIDLLFGE
jgi:predicted regulator of Ras-like GTPase activity (Roadblock/LC7/MglB family)